MEKENVEKIVNVDSIIGNIIITGDFSLRKWMNFTQKFIVIEMTFSFNQIIFILFLLLQYRITYCWKF